jgi:hypothetical protein
LHIAEVQIVADDDFGALLRDMRLWLDEQHFEPLIFTYFDTNPGMSVHVAFKVGREAEAFARRFGGCLK